MRVVTLLTLAAVACALAACGADETSEPAPSACLGGANAYLAALEDAPGDVLLDGETPISECIVESQSGGELATAGEAMVAAATDLNGEAIKDPGGEATLQLGYLVGAVQQAASETGGIHEDLVRRLDTAARYAPHGKQPGSEFERVFGEGYAAGQARG